jgi:hypothetical protein
MFFYQNLGQNNHYYWIVKKLTKAMLSTLLPDGENTSYYDSILMSCKKSRILAQETTSHIRIEE